MSRLQEVVTDLLPPLHSTGLSSDDSILSVDRLHILRSLLPVLASSRTLQRMAEGLLRTIKDRGQRKTDREKERATLSDKAEVSNVSHSHAPVLFPHLQLNGLDKTNGFHSTSSSSSSSSPSPVNGHAKDLSSKHAHLEQRLAGVARVGARGAGFSDDGEGGGAIGLVPVDHHASD